MKSSLLDRMRNSNLAVLVVICILGIIVLAVKSGGEVLSGNSINGFLTFLAVPVLIGLAQMVCLSVGQMNLAVGAMGGASAAFMATLMQNHGMSAFLAVVLGLVMATGVGFFNGLVVVLTRINGFIVTLATMSIMLGVQYRFVESFTVDRYSQSLKDFGAASILNVPMVFLLAVVCALAVAWFYRRLLPGRRLLAFGGNPVAARLSGVSESKVLILAHTLSGLLIGIAAFVSVCALPGINQSVGGDWLLPSFAAPIIGGVALSGGGVAVLGTVMAAVLVRLIDTAKAEFQLDPNWVPFIVGLVVLGTVLLTTFRTSANVKRLKNKAVRT